LRPKVAASHKCFPREACNQLTIPEKEKRKRKVFGLGSRQLFVCGQGCRLLAAQK